MVKEELELRFLRNFKSAVTSFHMLDGNMAACLDWVRDDGNNKPFDKSIQSLAFDKKFKRIQKLVSIEKKTKEYKDFFELVERCRVFRNRLVHGEWNLISPAYEKISYQVRYPKEEGGIMTQDEFEKQTKFIENSNRVFIYLRKKYPLEAIFKAQPVAGGDATR